LCRTLRYTSNITKWLTARTYQTPSPTDFEPDDSAQYHSLNEAPPTFTVIQPIGIPCHGASNRAGMHSPPPRPALDRDFDATYESQPARYVQVGGSRVLECPSIRITTISPQNGHGDFEEDFCPNGWDSTPSERLSRDYLYLPLDPYSYRDASLSPSPASSLSSRSWFSDASSCESLHQICDDVDSELNEATSRFTLGSPLGSPRGSSPRLWPHYDPCLSPREDNLLSPQVPASLCSSRPNSPCGKRRYSSSEAYFSASPHSSPTPSPALSRRGSITDEMFTGEGPLLKELAPCSSPFDYGPSEVDNIPQKTRKTSAEQTVSLSRKQEHSGNGGSKGALPTTGGEDEGPGMYSPVRKENAGMDYLAVPSPLAWSKARIAGHSPVFR
uniref:RHD domain-containing protein n=1 Tax=Latimeria chalumnae TaxID=7897 RepID=H3AJD7_LATCH